MYLGFWEKNLSLNSLPIDNNIFKWSILDGLFIFFSITSLYITASPFTRKCQKYYKQNVLFTSQMRKYRLKLRGEFELKIRILNSRFPTLIPWQYNSSCESWMKIKSQLCLQVKFFNSTKILVYSGYTSHETFLVPSIEWILFKRQKAC